MKVPKVTYVHSNLILRNIYLAMDRMITQKEVDRTIENIGEPFWDESEKVV